jgi:hypothetical protein
MSSLQLQRALVLVLALSPVARAWVTPSASSSSKHSLAVGRSAALRPSRIAIVLSAKGDSSSTTDSEDAESRSTSFAKADQSLIEEADKKRMDEMGDFDLNADVRKEECLSVQEYDYDVVLWSAGHSVELRYASYS